MDKFHSDLPITGNQDSPDALNRTEYATRLARSLILSEDSSSVVISIEGKWGHGKSSILNLIKKELNKDKVNKPIIFDFNPWLVGSAKNLVQEFLVQFASTIGASSTSQKSQKAAKELLAYSQIFTVMKWIPGAEPWTSLIESVFKGVGTATKEISKLKELSIEQRKDAVIDSLKKLKKPILVFIDDLDRLPPDEVFQMIRAVKAVTEIPRTVFILAFEREYVEQALQSHKIKEPDKYLDKLIQVRLNLPKISEADIHKLALEELDNLSDIKLTQYFGTDQQRLGEVYQLCIKPIIKSPREIKRIFNRLYFVEKATRGEVAFTDLFGLETLAIKAQSVYEHIITNPGAYTGIPTEVDFTFTKKEEILGKFKADREKAIKTVSNEEKPYINNLLEELFPLLKGSAYGGLSQGEYSQEGRIAANDRLLIAISYGLPNEEVSIKDIRTFINISSQRKKIIEDNFTSDKIERFIDLLRQIVIKMQPKDPLEFIQEIGKMVEYKIIGDFEVKPRDFLSMGPIRQLWWVVKNVINSQEADARRETIKSVISDKQLISLSSYIMDECIRQHGEIKSDDIIPPGDRWFSDKQLIVLKKTWFATCSKSIKDKSFLDINAKTRAFFTMRRIEKKPMAELFSPLLITNDDLDKFVLTFRGYGQDSIKGEYVKVDEDWLLSIGEIKKIRKRVKDRIEENVTDKVLLALYKSMLTGNAYYIMDVSEREEW